MTDRIDCFKARRQLQTQLRDQPVLIALPSPADTLAMRQEPIDTQRVDSAFSASIPEDTTIMNFWHLLEKHQVAAEILETINDYLRDHRLSLRQGTIVDATIIHATRSTKTKEGKRDPEMHQTKKGNPYFFGMKVHIGADAESGRVHHVPGTAAKVADVTGARI